MAGRVFRGGKMKGKAGLTNTGLENSTDDTAAFPRGVARDRASRVSGTESSRSNDFTNSFAERKTKRPSTGWKKCRAFAFPAYPPFPLFSSLPRPPLPLVTLPVFRPRSRCSLDENARSTPVFKAKLDFGRVCAF